MALRHEVAFGMVAALMLAGSGSAIAQECRSLSPTMRDSQHSLYQHALIAEAAYGRQIADGNASDPTAYCQDSTTGRRTDYDGLRISTAVVLLPSVVSTQWQGLVTELELRLYYNPRNGVTYLGCSQDRDIDLAITWTDVLRPLDGDGTARVVVFEVVLLAAATVLPDVEQLGVTRLVRFEPEPLTEWFAIQGTDFTQHPQLQSSVQDLLDGSCVFSVAALVVGSLREQAPSHVLSVVGHSLGGAAAQYVANERAVRRELIGERRPDGVDAYYSFNSVGLRASELADLPQLHSYYVDGEILSGYSAQLGRVQGGHVYRYIPDRDSGSVWDADASERHRLPAVQEGLCQCINGNGFLDYRGTH